MVGMVYKDTEFQEVSQDGLPHQHYLPPTNRIPISILDAANTESAFLVEVVPEYIWAAKTEVTAPSVIAIVLRR